MTVKEALADAKRIKAVAEEHARLSLQEEFQPRIQRMVSSKIREEDEDIETQDTDDSDDMEMDSPTPDFDSSEADVTEPEPDIADEEPVEENDEFSDDELDEIIRELDSEDDELDEEFDIFDDEWYDEDENSHQLDITEMDDEEDLEESDDEGMDDDVLESLIRELEDGDEDMDDMNENDGYDKKISENRRRRFRSQNNFKGNASKIKTSLKEAVNTIKVLKKKLHEATRANSIIKHALNETNLLNAKLLYYNKINAKTTLGENKKIKVMDQFDRCKSIKECKLVYATLIESLVPRKKSINERTNFKPASQIKTPPSSRGFLIENQSVNNQGLINTSRLQELAGIKRK